MSWLVEVDNNKSTLPVVFSGRNESSFLKKILESEAILTREIPVKTPTTIVNNLTFLSVLLVYSFFGRRRRLSNCPGIFLSVLLLEILCLTRLRQIGSLVLFYLKSITKTLWHFFLDFIGNRLTKFITQGPFCIAKQCKRPKQTLRNTKVLALTTKDVRLKIWKIPLVLCDREYDAVFIQEQTKDLDVRNLFSFLKLY